MASNAFDVSTNSTRKHGHHQPHIAALPNESISVLTPYSGLIITVCMVVLMLIRFYLLEKWLFPRYYKETYTNMDDGLRRGFLNHHIAGATKIVLLVVGVYPWAIVLFGEASLHTPLGKHFHPTTGDILIILTQLFVASYIFELFYRRTMSPIAVAHHVGAVVIAQSAVVLSLDLSHQQDATLEYLLCLVWGAFDVLSEFWLNVAFIVYRVVPNNHKLLTYIFFATFSISTTGTIAETIMIFYLFGGSWSRWELSFKVVTPILHVLFTAAQIHAARILLAMWKKEKRKLVNDAELDELEAGSKTKASKDERNVVVAAEAVPGDESDSIHAIPSTAVLSQHNDGQDRQRRGGFLGRTLGSAKKFVTGR